VITNLENIFLTVSVTKLAYVLVKQSRLAHSTQNALCDMLLREYVKHIGLRLWRIVLMKLHTSYIIWRKDQI